MSIIHTFDPCPDAVINPDSGHIRRPRKLDACIITFSAAVMKGLLNQGVLELVEKDAIHYISGDINMYAFKGTNIGVIQTWVGAPFTTSLIEDVGYSFSCPKFIVFGSCGGLVDALGADALVVPTDAYRDEGVSYHYAPAADYIHVKNHPTVSAVMDKLKIPYFKGKCWTTDAFFRETRRNTERRVTEGCIAVDMELAALQAVCDFRGYELYQFVYTGDTLASDEWDEGILATISQNDQLTHFYIALEIAKYVTEEHHE